MLTRFRNSLFIALVVLVFSACSGGGDSAAPAQQSAQQGSGQWNQLVWDQDSWQ